MIKILIGLAISSSLLFSYSMDYDKNTVGVVRNIKVYKDPKWVVKIEIVMGKKIFFVSQKYMIDFYHQSGKGFDIDFKM